MREKLKAFAITCVIALGASSMVLLGGNEMLLHLDRAACRNVPQAEFVEHAWGYWECRLQLHDGTYVKVENPRASK